MAAIGTAPGSGPVMPGNCSCASDPYAALPAERRPRVKKRGSLRRVCCTACGKEYFTNRRTDICLDCEESQPENRGQPDLGQSG